MNDQIISLKSNNVIEFLESMDGDQLSSFIHKLVCSKPDLAEDISSYISFSLVDLKVQ